MLEIEKNFFVYNKSKIIKTIKKMKGKYIGTYLFKVYSFNTKNKNVKRLRIRDEGTKKTLTVKMSGNKYDDEYEINIDNVEVACKILINLGFEQNDYYEKIREIYYLNNNEFSFDTIPGLGEYLQIESSSEKELNKIIKIFGLNDNDDLKTEEKKLYDKYGFDFDLFSSITYRSFKNINKYVKKLVTKNKSEYILFFNNQLKLYNDTIKSS